MAAEKPLRIIEVLSTARAQKYGFGTVRRGEAGSLGEALQLAKKLQKEHGKELFIEKSGEPATKEGMSKVLAIKKSAEVIAAQLHQRLGITIT